MGEICYFIKLLHLTRQKLTMSKRRQTIHILYGMSKELMIAGAGKLFQVIITLI